jgi:U3 small nucleolar RNA-associated protein 3
LTFLQYSSAPELVGLLAELNDALEELENRVNPILSKVSFIFLQYFCL